MSQFFKSWLLIAACLFTYVHCQSDGSAEAQPEIDLFKERTVKNIPERTIFETSPNIPSFIEIERDSNNTTYSSEIASQVSDEYTLSMDSLEQPTTRPSQNNDTTNTTETNIHSEEPAIDALNLDLLSDLSTITYQDDNDLPLKDDGDVSFENDDYVEDANLFEDVAEDDVFTDDYTDASTEKYGINSSTEVPEDAKKGYDIIQGWLDQDRIDSNTSNSITTENIVNTNEEIVTPLIHSKVPTTPETIVPTTEMLIEEQPKIILKENFDATMHNATDSDSNSQSENKEIAIPSEIVETDLNTENPTEDKTEQLNIMLIKDTDAIRYNATDSDSSFQSENKEISIPSEIVETDLNTEAPTNDKTELLKIISIKDTDALMHSAADSASNSQSENKEIAIPSEIVETDLNTEAPTEDKTELLKIIPIKDTDALMHNATDSDSNSNSQSENKEIAIPSEIVETDLNTEAPTEDKTEQLKIISINDTDAFRHNATDSDSNSQSENKEIAIPTDFVETDLNTEAPTEDKTEQSKATEDDESLDYNIRDNISENELKIIKEIVNDVYEEVANATNKKQPKEISLESMILPQEVFTDSSTDTIIVNPDIATEVKEMNQLLIDALGTEGTTTMAPNLDSIDENTQFVNKDIDKLDLNQLRIDAMNTNLDNNNEYTPSTENIFRDLKELDALYPEGTKLDNMDTTTIAKEEIDSDQLNVDKLDQDVTKIANLDTVDEDFQILKELEKELGLDDLSVEPLYTEKTTKTSINNDPQNSYKDLEPLFAEKNSNITIDTDILETTTNYDNLSTINSNPNYDNTLDVKPIGNEESTHLNENIERHEIKMNGQVTDIQVTAPYKDLSASNEVIIQSDLNENSIDHVNSTETPIDKFEKLIAIKNEGIRLDTTTDISNISAVNFKPTDKIEEFIAIKNEGNTLDTTTDIPNISAVHFTPTDKIDEFIEIKNEDINMDTTTDIPNISDAILQIFTDDVTATEDAILPETTEANNEIFGTTQSLEHLEATYSSVSNINENKELTGEEIVDVVPELGNESIYAEEMEHMLEELTTDVNIDDTVTENINKSGEDAKSTLVKLIEEQIEGLTNEQIYNKEDAIIDKIEEEIDILNKMDSTTPTLIDFETDSLGSDDRKKGDYPRIDLVDDNDDLGKENNNLGKENDYDNKDDINMEEYDLDNKNDDLDLDDNLDKLDYINNENVDETNRETKKIKEMVDLANEDYESSTQFITDVNNLDENEKSENINTNTSLIKETNDNLNETISIIDKALKNIEDALKMEEEANKPIINVLKTSNLEPIEEVIYASNEHANMLNETIDVSDHADEEIESESTIFSKENKLLNSILKSNEKIKAYETTPESESIETFNFDLINKELDKDIEEILKDIEEVQVSSKGSSELIESKFELISGTVKDSFDGKCLGYNMSLKITANNTIIPIPKNALILANCTEIKTNLKITWRSPNYQKNNTINLIIKHINNYVFIDSINIEINYPLEIIYKERTNLEAISLKEDNNIKIPEIIDFGNGLQLHLNNVDFQAFSSSYNTVLSEELSKTFALQIASGSVILLVILISLGYLVYRRIKSKTRIFKVAMDK